MSLLDNSCGWPYILTPLWREKVKRNSPTEINSVKYLANSFGCNWGHTDYILARQFLAELLTLKSMSDGNAQSKRHLLVSIDYFAYWPAHTNSFGRSECADGNLYPSPCCPPPFPQQATDRRAAYLSWWSIPVSISRSEHSDEGFYQATQSWEQDGLEMRHIRGGEGR